MKSKNNDRGRRSAANAGKSRPKPPFKRGPRAARDDRKMDRPAPTEVTSPGLLARQAAVELIYAVMVSGRALDHALAKTFGAPAFESIEPRDRALARLIAMTVLRLHGDLAACLNTFLEKPLDQSKSKIWSILLAGTAQLRVLKISPHAAISLSVDLARSQPDTERFAKLVNAILRRVSEIDDSEDTASFGGKQNIPAWMLESWRDSYGAETAEKIARASLREPALDVSVKSDAAVWAEALDGTVLPTGTIRADVSGRIEDQPGFAEGAWWVQDCAAALPAKLFADLEGKRVADLCAAPGGKTLQLAARGAEVTAVDIGITRLEKLRENLARTSLSAQVVAADVLDWSPAEKCDGILLDAPCTATGTIRRHPDILHLKRATDLRDLVTLQSRLLRRAAPWVKPGGELIYCTCSLQSAECEQQIERFLDQHPAFERKPICPGEAGIEAAWLTPLGDLRTFPHHLDLGPKGLSGIDGFYTARLVRKPG